MSNKINLNLFLLKSEYSIDDFEDIINDDYEYDCYDLDPSVNTNGKICVGKNKETIPDWFEFLDEGSLDDNIFEDYINKSNRALLFIESKNRLFVLAFGYGRHMIDKTAVEHRFGLKTVIKAIGPDQIKSINTITIDENSIKTDKQSAEELNIEDFMVDSYKDFMRGVTAVASDGFFDCTITGKDNFSFSTDADFEELDYVCGEILDIYIKEDYPERLKFIDNIENINDPELKSILNKELVKALNNNEAGKISLAPPEVVDYDNIKCFSFTPKGDKYQDLKASHLFNYLENRNTELSIHNLGNCKIYYEMLDLEEQSHWKLSDCIIYSCKHEDDQYMLVYGNWFKIDQDFLAEIDDKISDIPDSKLDLIDYNHNKDNGNFSEANYNKAVGEEHENIICLDQNNIQVAETHGKYEFCDLLSKDKEIIHVKRWKSSSTLSHLFAQGRISADAFINNSNSYEKIKEKVLAEDESFDVIFPEEGRENLDPREFKIVYAIIYSKDKKIEERLPFFSKLNMVHSAEELKRLNFDVEKLRIKNVSD